MSLLDTLSASIKTAVLSLALFIARSDGFLLSLCQPLGQDLKKYSESIQVVREKSMGDVMRENPRESSSRIETTAVSSAEFPSTPSA